MPHRLEHFPSKETIGLFRDVFSTPKGREVLSVLLGDFGVFLYTSDSTEDIVLRNYGIRLLNILSGDAPTEDSPSGGPSKDNMQDFVKRLMKQPLPKVKDDS